MREKILTFIEKNSRIDLKELAIILGVDEASVVNELQKMEEEHIDKLMTRIKVTPRCHCQILCS